MNNICVFFLPFSLFSRAGFTGGVAVAGASGGGGATGGDGRRKPPLGKPFIDDLFCELSVSHSRQPLLHDIIET